MTRKLTLLTFALTLGAVSLSIAQEPTAEDILKKCAAAYQEVKSYQDTAATEDRAVNGVAQASSLHKMPTGCRRYKAKADS
jgi:outer membrane lipoprotein-sorting protein